MTHKVVATDFVPADSMLAISAVCDPGEVVLGGGYQTASINPDVRVITNAPHLEGADQGWLVSVANPSAADFQIWSFAVCAPGSSTEFE